MKVEVHKFGGASVKDAAGIKNVCNLLKKIESDSNIVVISAMGKTTNSLEKVVSLYMKSDPMAMEYYEKIRAKHINIMQELGLDDPAAITDIMDTFVEIEWILEDEVQDSYDYIYDQIVSVGELVSSKLLYHFAKSQHVSITWTDVRGLIMTDNTYREAKVDWKTTNDNIERESKPLLEKNKFVITQGFISSSSENFTTTLGREGSDYSAGIFSYALDAKSLTIWKDVAGILTADPRKFENVTKIDRLSYREAIEMTYYGAKVIHPKTIKPLQNKSIRLYVKPFNDFEAKGTIITSNVEIVYPPVIVIEEDQIILHISTKDFSFVAEEHLSEIFAILTELNIKVNMMRNTAISFSLCLQNNREKIGKLTTKLSHKYGVVEDLNLDLITIRHYDGKTRQALTEGKVVYFEEIISNTIRLAVKDIPQVKRK